MKVCLTTTPKEEKIIEVLLDSGIYSNKTELFRACVREIMQEFRHNGYLDVIGNGKE